MPSWALKTFKKLNYQQGVECAYGGEQSFADLIFVIDNAEYAVPSHHWNEREVDKSLPLGGRCFSTITSLDIMQPGHQNLFILGDSFMQIFYTVFDRDLDRVGFGLARHT